MSKRSDDDATEFDDGMSTSERRRRRRRGGIRIPSDNVPRRTDSQPVAAPVPEDPSLAVSIAYAFSDDAGRAPTTLPPDEIVADLDDATAIGGVPDAGIPGAIDDVVPDGRTRQMPAVNLEALGLTALEFEDSPPAVDTTAEMPVVVESTRTTGEVEAVDIIVDDAGVADGVPKAPMARAATVALSEDDLEELMESTVLGVVPPRAKPTTAPPVPPPIERPRQTAPPMAAVQAAPPAPAMPTTTPPTPTPAPVAAPPAASLTPVTVSFTTPAPSPAAPTLVEPAVEPSAAAPAAVADAGDSSEILADEILEVEEQGRAPAVEVSSVPVAIPAQPSGPVALPPSAPPPPPAAAKPPPPAPAAPAAKKPMAAAAPAAEDKRKRRGKPWFEDLFDEDYLRTLPFLTPQTTQAEAAMVVESLGLSPGAQVLDLGCGYGRHAMELAARGMNMVGVDLSLPMLLRGADEAQRRGLDINFVHVDMREIDFDAQFDGAYCLFSTFGFFDDETNKKTASLVAKALKPGAKFMLEVLNRDYVIGDLPTRVWWEGDGCVVLEEVEFNYFSSRVQSKRSVVFDDGRQIEQEISLRVYSLHEIGKLLHAAGLRVLEVSGAMATKGRFLGNRSREIIVIAERRTDAK